MKKAPCRFLWRGWAKYEVLPLDLSTFLLDFNSDLGENDCELELWSLGSKFFQVLEIWYLELLQQIDQ